MSADKSRSHDVIRSLWQGSTDRIRTFDRPSGASPHVHLGWFYFSLCSPFRYDGDRSPIFSLLLTYDPYRSGVTGRRAHGRLRGDECAKLGTSKGSFWAAWAWTWLGGRVSLMGTPPSTVLGTETPLLDACRSRSSPAVSAMQNVYSILQRLDLHPRAHGWQQ